MLRGPATPRSRSHTSSSRFVQPPHAVGIVMTSELAMKEGSLSPSFSFLLRQVDFLNHDRIISDLRTEPELRT